MDDIWLSLVRDVLNEHVDVMCGGVNSGEGNEAGRRPDKLGGIMDGRSEEDCLNGGSCEEEGS
ncbi:hypothetical protein SERLADRAFT_387707 [Serpula lacrymans var. lacrymans S7.9]|uniref:Uncharacterized protein n=1 Tax=Serpula lacrymans var. lacrymans (strain S7.9) TaxID=578457 RepID=F8NT91_SERL9|nr:uncharacterized protein SERLADRAFT_387707 [Serpula lacrymans var. lacrymans S7.9]EGO25564.1 hypothetical protein SERLADRAFT_387707 [Serpula lacrymans var. lacrymans S7.9]